MDGSHLPMLAGHAARRASASPTFTIYPLQGHWQTHGIGLPDDVLRQMYAGNARRILLKDR